METPKLFSPLAIGSTLLRNRIVRSGTFEGRCDADGAPTAGYVEHYRRLATSGVGAIVTGFVYVSREGRAMHPGQGGMDSAKKVAPFSAAAHAAREADTPIFLQLAHAGRQTRAEATGERVVGASTKRSAYFRSRPRALSTKEASEVADRFGDAAARAREAGFDGVQLHAAHGYLIHQFLHPALCRRDDEYGPDSTTGIGTRFLGRCIEAVCAKAGEDYPIWTKVSASDDLSTPMGPARFDALIDFLDRARVACIEVSYGTMDYPMSIFRGGVPRDLVLAHNPLFATRNPLARAAFHALVMPFMNARHRPFSSGYNLEAAARAATRTDVPVLCVGGWRGGVEMERALRETPVSGISMCRPLIREPDFVARLEASLDAISTCTNCNRCAVMCDSGRPTCCMPS